MKIVSLSLSAFVVFLASSSVTASQTAPRSSTDEARMGMTALAEVKQIAMACLILSTDNRDILKTSPVTAKKDLLPYLRDNSLWTAPGDPKGTASFSLNPALAGKYLPRIPEIAKTVLVYEGKNGKPKFRYEGRAVIGFADGHAKLLTQSEAKSLIWKP